MKKARSLFPRFFAFSLLLLQHRIRNELAQQEHQHHQHHGADELCPLAEGEVGAQQVARDAADGTGDADGKKTTSPLMR